MALSALERTLVAEVLRLLDVNDHVAILGRLADDHALVAFVAGLTKRRPRS